MTGPIKAAVGTAAAPGYIFTGDTNTGLYHIGADEVGIACNGAKVVDVSTTGVDVTGTLSQNGLAVLLPVGFGPCPFAGVNAPTGWLLCYGQAISRTTYSTLYAVIGNLYGAGNGTTTFNVPDMRGRGAVGFDAMGGSAANRLTTAYYGGDPSNIAVAGGAQSDTLLAANLPSYTPSGTNAVSATTAPGSAVGGLNAGSTTFYTTGGGNISSGQAAGQAFTGVAQGGVSTPISTIQPSLTTSFIIYAGA